MSLKFITCKLKTETIRSYQYNDYVKVNRKFELAEAQRENSRHLDLATYVRDDVVSQNGDFKIISLTVVRESKSNYYRDGAPPNPHTVPTSRLIPEDLATWNVTK